MTPREMDRLSIGERKLVERCLQTGTKPNLDVGPEIILALRLAAINAAIWERENRLRRLRDDAGSHPQDAGFVAFETTRLNDWRSAIIGEKKVYRG